MGGNASSDIDVYPSDKAKTLFFETSQQLQRFTLLFTTALRRNADNLVEDTGKLDGRTKLRWESINRYSFLEMQRRSRAEFADIMVALGLEQSCPYCGTFYGKNILKEKCGSCGNKREIDPDLISRFGHLVTGDLFLTPSQYDHSKTNADYYLGFYLWALNLDYSQALEWFERAS